MVGGLEKAGTGGVDREGSECVEKAKGLEDRNGFRRVGLR